MKTAFNTIVAALAVSATALTPALAQRSGASGDAPGADNNRHGVYQQYKPYKHWPKRHYKGRHGPKVVYRKHYHHKRHDNGAAAAIIGLAGAAIIAGALANQPQIREYRVAPSPYPRSPRRSGPNVITYESSLEPWTAGWYRWCDNRYRSFNPETGTFRGYDGLDHFCVPK